MARHGRTSRLVALSLLAVACRGGPDMATALHDGDESLAAALSAGGDANASDDDGEPLLQAAVMRADVRSLQVLLVHGARIDARDAQGRTALYIAAGFGRPECAYVLLAAGASPNVRSGPTDETPLHVGVGSPEISEMLLAHGADVNAADTWGETALHDVAFVERAQAEVTANLLVSHGANLDARDVRGYTPLHQTAELDNLALVDVYRAHAHDLSPRSLEGFTPLDVAVARGAVRAADLLYRAGGQPAQTAHFVPPLHLAAKVDDLDQARLLLSFGADPNAVFDGKTPGDVARENRSARVLALLAHAASAPSNAAP